MANSGAVAEIVGPDTQPARAQRGEARWTHALRTPVGAGAALGLLVIVTLAVLAPTVWGDRAGGVAPAHILEGPSPEHWIGTDNLGRDLFFRTLVATRLSLVLAMLATAIAVVLGLLLGTLPVLAGRRVGRLASALVNLAVAFPGLLVALFFAVVFGVGARGAVLAIGLAGAPGFARLSQTLVASVGSRDYVAAARIAGVGRWRILWRHVLPNVAEPLVVNATIGAGAALLSFSGLSFLGLGVQPPRYDWGRLLGDGLNRIYDNPVAAIAPGIAVVVAGLSFNLLGEAVAGALGTPTLRTRTLLGDGRQRHAVTQPWPPTEGAAVDVADLRVTRADGVDLVRGVSLGLAPGEAVGVVGESGSGKSLTALAMARLTDPSLRVSARRLVFDGEDLMAASPKQVRRLLGTSLTMVFQDPSSSLNPTQRVGGQLAEVARQHQGASRRQARDRAVNRLRMVRVPAAERRARQYPHEFSGGMRQRAMIGLGLMGSPRLVIADEPTTALDVTVQQQVLRLLHQVCSTQGTALLLISHDVSVVAEVCDRVLVMYAGRIVEEIPAAQLHHGGRHPYTRALAAAVPDMTTPVDRPLPVIPGRPVDPASVPVGCAYADRCPLADERCRVEDPPLVDGVACWHAGERTGGEV